MAGILASSASKVVAAGDTTADNLVSGFVTGEQIVLGVTPAASTSLAWGQAIPSGSAVARSQLNDAEIAAPVFTPDAAGVYVVTVIVDSVTTYVLRISVTALATVTPAQSVHFLPVLNSQVPTPALGARMFYSADEDAMCVRLADGTVHPIELGAAV